MKKKSASFLVGLMVLLGLQAPANACEEHEAKTEGPVTTSTGLQYEDVVAGSGDLAKAGKKVEVHYTGTLHPTGEKFDSSVDRDEPFEFKLGASQVIAGWDEGVSGMKEGGKRILIIPPQLAYGKGGVPGAIPPNATLKFEVELLKVK